MNHRGFSIVELLVSVAIFAFLTAFLVSKYGNFNQSILLTNLAYDVAITLRNAQNYGINVKSAPDVVNNVNYSEEFKLGYGVHFDTHTGTPAPNTEMIFYADTNNSFSYNPGTDSLLGRYVLRNGSKVSSICTNDTGDSCPTSGTGVDGTVGDLDVVFIRPSPDANFGSNGSSINAKFAQITLQTPNGQTKKVVVRRTGQIGVIN